MRKRLFLISLLLSSAACSPSERETTSGAEMISNSPAVPQPPEVPETTPGTNLDDNEERNGGRREFAYSWPSEVNRIPELSARLEAERDTQLEAQKAQWQEVVDDPSFEDCVTCKTLASEVEWKVIADLPDYLSLSADIYSYTGGAHGMSGLNTLVWDKRAGNEVEGGTLFVSTVALENALGTKVCDALDRERARRRGGPVVRNHEWSTDCPSLEDATVLVGSSNGEYFDRIGVYFGPYTAGSYAEGPYELNFPVTASIIDAVKPQYASAFRVKR